MSMVLVGNSSFQFFNPFCNSQGSKMIGHIENGFDMIGFFFFSRKLDDSIRTVVRGQTNVGQDGRQVHAPHLRQSQWFSSCDAALRIALAGRNLFS